MKVSIILPVYNVEKYFSACLDSVCSQTHKDLEIILVNDGSKDNSGSIADSYALKDKRIKVIHKINEGVSVARNVGIEHSTGEYVCFCDSDDLLMPDYVEYLLNMAVSNNAQIAVTNRFHYTYHGVNFTADPSDSPYVIKGTEAAKKMLYYHFAIGCYNKIFSRKFLGDDIRFIPGVFVGEGFNFNVYALCKAKRVVVGNRRVYLYRMDNTESCMTAFNINKCKMAIKAIDIIRERLPIVNNDLLNACDYAKWHTTADMYNWMVLTTGSRDYPDICREYKKKVWTGAASAILAPVKLIEKIKACIQLINPRLWVYALQLRQYLTTINSDK